VAFHYHCWFGKIFSAGSSTSAKQGAIFRLNTNICSFHALLLASDSSLRCAITLHFQHCFAHAPADRPPRALPHTAAFRRYFAAAPHITSPMLSYADIFFVRHDNPPACRLAFRDAKDFTVRPASASTPSRPPVRYRCKMPGSAGRPALRYATQHG